MSKTRISIGIVKQFLDFKINNVLKIRACLKPDACLKSLKLIQNLMLIQSLMLVSKPDSCQKPEAFLKPGGPEVAWTSCSRPVLLRCFNRRLKSDDCLNFSNFLNSIRNQHTRLRRCCMNSLCNCSCKICFLC